jgi:hypothetical protein
MLPSWSIGRGVGSNKVVANPGKGGVFQDELRLDSWVSRADVAHFLLDEVEQRGHPHQIVGIAGVGRRTSPERHARGQAQPTRQRVGPT